MSNIIRGISFGSVCNSCEKNLIAYQNHYNCIEFPCEKPCELEMLINCHCNKNVRYALHYPSYESAAQIGFDLSHKENRNKVYCDFLHYISRFPKAAYYLFHFPGCREHGESVPSIQMMEAFGEFKQMFRNFTDRIVLENLTCYTAICYSKLLYSSDFRLCLDIGHAHLRGGNEIEDYFTLFRDKIAVVHFYNTTNKHGHPCFGKHLSPDCSIVSGINIQHVLQQVYSLSTDVYLIDESDPTAFIF